MNVSERGTSTFFKQYSFNGNLSDNSCCEIHASFLECTFALKEFGYCTAQRRMGAGNGDDVGENVESCHFISPLVGLDVVLVEAPFYAPVRAHRERLLLVEESFELFSGTLATVAHASVPAGRRVLAVVGEVGGTLIVVGLAVGEEVGEANEDGDGAAVESHGCAPWLKVKAILPAT